MLDHLALGRGQLDRLAHLRTDAAWFANAARVMRPGASFYVWGGYANVANYPPALKAAGLLDQVTVVGFDANPNAADAVLAGELEATIAQAPSNMGKFGVDALVAPADTAHWRYADAESTLVTTAAAVQYKNTKIGAAVKYAADHTDTPDAHGFLLWLGLWGG